MNCRDFEERIHRVLDQRGILQTDAPLIHHTKSCRRCRALLRKYIRLFEVLQRPNDTFDSCDIASDVCLVLHETGFFRVSRRRVIRHRFAWFAAAAALVGLAVGLHWMSDYRPRSGDTSAVAAGASTEPKPASAVTQDNASRDVSKQSAGIAPRSKPARLAAQAVAQVQGSARPTDKQPDQLAPRIEPPSDSLARPVGSPIEVIETVLDLPWSNVQAVAAPGHHGYVYPDWRDGLAPLASWLENAIATLADQLPFGKRSEPNDRQARNALEVIVG